MANFEWQIRELQFYLQIPYKQSKVALDSFSFKYTEIVHRSLSSIL